MANGTLGPTADLNTISAHAPDFVTAVWGPRTAPTNGRLVSASIKCSGTGPFALGVYTDNAAYPGSLVAQTGGDVATGVLSWHTLALPGGVLIAGASYWLALVSGTANLSLRYAVELGQSIRFSAKAYDGTFPDPFPGGATVFNAGASMQAYLTYAAEGGGGVFTW